MNSPTKNETSSVKRQTTNIKRQTSNVKRQTLHFSATISSPGHSQILSRSLFLHGYEGVAWGRSLEQGLRFRYQKRLHDVIDLLSCYGNWTTAWLSLVYEATAWLSCMQRRFTYHAGIYGITIAFGRYILSMSWVGSGHETTVIYGLPCVNIWSDTSMSCCTYRMHAHFRGLLSCMLTSRVSAAVIFCSRTASLPQHHTTKPLHSGSVHIDLFVHPSVITQAYMSICHFQVHMY